MTMGYLHSGCSNYIDGIGYCLELDDPMNTLLMLDKPCVVAANWDLLP